MATFDHNYDSSPLRNNEHELSAFFYYFYHLNHIN